jgi:hypothetical protein
LTEWEHVTASALSGASFRCSPLMPQKLIEYCVVTVPSPLGGMDKRPNYKYCQYISPAVSHNNRHCTCWDWERTEVVQHK